MGPGIGIQIIMEEIFGLPQGETPNYEAMVTDDDRDKARERFPNATRVEIDLCAEEIAARRIALEQSIKEQKQAFEN